jgi:hypothetical protein
MACFTGATGFLTMGLFAGAMKGLVMAGAFAGAIGVFTGTVGVFAVGFGALTGIDGDLTGVLGIFTGAFTGVCTGTFFTGTVAFAGAVGFAGDVFAGTFPGDFTGPCAHVEAKRPTNVKSTTCMAPKFEDGWRRLWLG